MAIVLRNDFIELEVSPELGGKISRLCDRRSGRDWLWKNPHLPMRPPQYGESYVENIDSGGWDEIFPSVSPSKAGGFDIPDHGDLVGLSWEVIEQSDKMLFLGCDTRFANCRFERRISMEGERVTFEYILSNRSDKTVPWLWCAHPLIALEAGMRLSLPLNTPMSLKGGVGVVPEEFAWPLLERNDLPSLDRIPDPEAPGFRPFAAKIFSEANVLSDFSLFTPDQASVLRFAWNWRDTPFLGLWLNCRGWSGCGSAPYFNLGIEPATAPWDDLADAIADGSARFLAPGDVRQWSFEIRLESCL